ncbi:MAG TPA: FAD-dependent oxidoreductase [Ramlibacter sp.]|nr:FAD-dependent oxidoreductase [Ramlibacter sp.]
MGASFDGAAKAQTRVADVVVVGSGAAGLTAAVVARMSGLDVVLIEKANLLGGTTAISGGGIWVPCSPVAQRSGAADSLAAARLYMQSVCGENFCERRSDNFLRAGPRMIEMLERQAGIHFTVALDRPDYYPDAPGATLGGRCLFPTEFDGRGLGRQIRALRPPLREMTFLGMMMRPASDLRHFLNAGRSLKSLLFVLGRMLVLGRDRLLHGRSMQLAGGNALIAHLLRAALDRGVEIHRSTPARELLFEGDRVAGVLCDSPGGPLRLQARRGVVLAAGGFPHDPRLRSQHYPHPSGARQHVSPAPPSNTGDGIHMALRAGSYTPTLSDACCWAPVSVVTYGKGRSAAFPHLIDRQKPGFIAVTRQGRRFVNESHSYHEFGRGLIAATRGEPEASCFLVADHRAVRQYGMGFAKPAPMPLFPYLRMGYLVRADSIPELARKLGVDVQGLVETVETFNRHAREGKDPAHGRGSSAYNRYLGNISHRPNPCVAPIAAGPFYAVKLHMGELGTFSGLATNEHAQVLHRDGHAIEGLYAAGNDMSHVMGGNYLGGGSAIGPCMTFGYIAGRHLAGHRD